MTGYVIGPSGVLPPPPTGGAVAVDATGSKGAITGNTNTSGTYTGLTIVAGNALVVGLSFAHLSANVFPTAITAIWDTAGGSPTNQSMTQIASTYVTQFTGAHSQAVIAFGLLNPTAGNKTLSLSWTGGEECVIAAMSFTGVGSFTGSNFSSAASDPILAITSAAGHFTFANCCCLNVISAPTQTSIFVDNAETQLNYAASYATGAAPTVTHSWTAGATFSVVSGVDISP